MLVECHTLSLLVCMVSAGYGWGRSTYAACPRLTRSSGRGTWRGEVARWAGAAAGGTGTGAGAGRRRTGHESCRHGPCQYP